MINPELANAFITVNDMYEEVAARIEEADNNGIELDGEVLNFFDYESRWQGVKQLYEAYLHPTEDDNYTTLRMYAAIATGLEDEPEEVPTFTEPEDLPNVLMTMLVDDFPYYWQEVSNALDSYIKTYESK